jgi:sialidase-1
MPQHVDVFSAGSEGYHTFRIPAIVTAPDGSLIAFAEGRKENRNDPGGGDIELVCKRSEDQGATWSRLMVLDDPGPGWGASNPTPVTDRDTRRVWIVYNRWEPGFGTERSQPGTVNNQLWARFSDNNGKTWSEALDLTRQSRDFENWGAMFSGPGGAIQTRQGRLIVPAAMKLDRYRVWLSLGDFHGQVSLMRAYSLFSDDHGHTWQRGELLGALTNENQLVELADGSVLIDARQNAGPHRWFAISPDGGQSWSEPAPGQEVTPVCTAIERLSWPDDGGSRILWTGPDGPGRRKLVVRVSYDEGQTFEK